jgi:hypothetical protein
MQRQCLFYELTLCCLLLSAGLVRGQRVLNTGSPIKVRPVANVVHFNRSSSMSCSSAYCNTSSLLSN